MIELYFFITMFLCGDIDKFGLVIIDNDNDNINNNKFNFNFTISQLSMLLNKNMVIKNTNHYLAISMTTMAIIILILLYHNYQCC